MAAKLGNAQQESPQPEVEKESKKGDQEAQKAEERFAPLITFWMKINNDGIFNSSATLARANA